MKSVTNLYSSRCEILKKKKKHSKSKVDILVMFRVLEMVVLYAGNSLFTFFLLFLLSERNSALALKVLYLRAAMPREGKGISSIPEILLKF